VNVKRECEKSNTHFLLCVFHIGVSATWTWSANLWHVTVKRERETDRYMRRFFTFTHSIHGRGTKIRRPLSMREATEKLIRSTTKAMYCMNSLLNSTGTQTLKTGVVEYNCLTQHLWVHFKSINFSCKTMLILVRVFASMLMTVLLLLQKSTIKLFCYYRWLYNTHYCYACTCIHVHSIQSNELTA